MANEEQLKEAVDLRLRLDSDERRYHYDNKVFESYENKFSYVQRDIKLLRFAEGSLGSISDCYLLYAISMMGCASLKTIMIFLRALKNKNKDLSIGSMEDRDMERVKYRITSLSKNGFIYNHHYRVPGENGEYKNAVSLYSLDDDTIRFMNQKLAKRVRPDSWVFAKPLSDLIGIGASCYIGANVACSNNFLEYCSGVFMSKSLGQMRLAMELKMKNVTDDSIVYVGFLPAFLHYQNNRQTGDDYKDVCVYKINVIRNYFRYRDMKDADVGARIVIVVEDNKDLLRMGKLIHDTHILVEELHRIFFTGEGIFESKQGKKKFLQMTELTENENGFDFVAADTDFYL